MPYHNDPEATQWLHDYWDYIQTIERYPATFDEVGGWDGLAQAFIDSQIHQQVLDYLAYDDENGLTDRLNDLYNKYGNVKKMKKSGDWIQNWVDGKVEMNSFEANGVSFSLDMSSGGCAYSNDDELIYEGKEILVYMGLPFEDDFESEEDEIIYISAYDENMMELWTIPYSIYKVPTFAHAIGILEDTLRNNHIEAKSTKSAKKSKDIHTMIADIRNNNNSLKKSRVEFIGKNFYDNPYQDAEDDFQNEMASLGRILMDSGVNYNLKDRDLPEGYGYEIVFNSYEDGLKVVDRVADWADAHGFFTWLKDEGIITLTPN